jgi:hypothetical protein
LVGAGFARGASTVVFDFLKIRKKEKQTSRCIKTSLHSIAN